MPIYVIVSAIVVATSVSLLVWTMANSRQPATEAVARNLTTGGENLTDLRRALLQKSARERAVQPAIEMLARKGRRITPVGMVDALAHKMALAGVQQWGLERVLAAKVGFTLVGTLLALVIWSGGLTALSVTGGLIFIGVGYFGLDAILDGRGQRRQHEIQRELPDSLDQITISVEAGLGFESALARVGQTGTGPLAEELARTLQDVRLGVPRPEALDKLLHRTDVPDLVRFINAVRQAEGFGIPIAQVLRVQSGELRDKRRQRAEERAMKIPVKIVFPVVMCIFPALFIVIVGPAAIRFIENWPT